MTKPDYGIDAPGVVRNLFLSAAAGTLLDASVRVGLWSGVVFHVGIAHAGLWIAASCGFMGLWMLYDSKVGKLRERDRLLDLVSWRGDESVLDVGCGRGLMLVATAKRVARGSATGLDLWQAEDLTGNDPKATVENARREGVEGRVTVRTGDMREMPFPDASFDVVVSNVAIHNVYERAGRDRTMREIARVLRPGGSVVLHDIRYGDQYAQALRGEGLEVSRVGSKLLRVLLFVLTFGSLRPDVVTARKRSA